MSIKINTFMKIALGPTSKLNAKKSYMEIWMHKQEIGKMVYFPLLGDSISVYTSRHDAYVGCE